MVDFRHSDNPVPFSKLSVQDTLKKPVAFEVIISPEEISAFIRFHECVSDGEGYDVPIEMMKRLAEIGLVRRVTRDIYEHTLFGLSVIDDEVKEFINNEPVYIVGMGWKCDELPKEGTELFKAPPNLAAKCRELEDDYKKVSKLVSSQGIRLIIQECNLAELATKNNDLILALNILLKDKNVSTGNKAFISSVLSKYDSKDALNEIKDNCFCETCDLSKNAFKTHMAICPDCGDKRCAKAKNHINKCEKLNKEV